MVAKPDEQLATPEMPEFAPDPSEIEHWTALQLAVEKLALEQREVFMLTFYHGWKQCLIAELFGVDERTVRRWWRTASATTLKQPSMERWFCLTFGFCPI
jgi:DNA-directed RNA polymerase specialized sigma24 family protein